MSAVAGTIPHERFVTLHIVMISNVTRPLSRSPSKAYVTIELVYGFHNTSPSYRHNTLKDVWITELNSSPYKGLPVHNQFYDNNSWFQHLRERIILSS